MLINLAPPNEEITWLLHSRKDASPNLTMVMYLNIVIRKFNFLRTTFLGNIWPPDDPLVTITFAADFPTDKILSIPLQEYLYESKPLSCSLVIYWNVILSLFLIHLKQNHFKALYLLMMQHSKGHYVHNTRITNIYSLGNYIIMVYSRTAFKSYHLSRGPNFNPQRVSWVKT